MRKLVFLKWTFVNFVKMRPSTILSSAVILTLVLALFVQHRRAVEREEAISKRGASLLDVVNERIREKSRENEMLKVRIESLQLYIDQKVIDVKDRLPGLDVNVTDACKRADTVVVATYAGGSQGSDSTQGIERESGAVIQVKQVLKGASAEGESMTMSFWLDARTELLPTVGEDYIVFIEGTSRECQAIKVLQNSVWNVQAIRERAATTGPPRG